MSEQENIEDNLSELSNINTLDESLQLTVSINNNLVTMIELLQKINNELCKMVSNVNNVIFVTDRKIDDINQSI